MTKKIEGKFWVVWRVGGDIPVRQYGGIGFALQEANRLSEKLPGEIFYVLESVGMKFKPVAQKRQEIKCQKG